MKENNTELLTGVRGMQIIILTQFEFMYIYCKEVLTTTVKNGD